MIRRFALGAWFLLGLTVPAMAQPSADDTFARLDLDGSGGISLQEMKEMRGNRFAQADVDQDGMLTKEEFLAPPPDAPEQASQRRGGGAIRGRAFNYMDSDGSGGLSLDEFVRPIEDRFAGWDKDGNGELSPEEMPTPRGGRRNAPAAPY